MKKYYWLLLAVLFASCDKGASIFKQDHIGVFIFYTIKKGNNNSDQSQYRPFDASELNFIVKFDSTAMYRTANPMNQTDVNKLYGFSDNNQEHHQFSARMGWRWYNNQLQLFAYNYNNGVNDFLMIKSVPLNQEINCSIKIVGNKYLFTVDGTIVERPRAATTLTSKGYLLYPYFGGTEPAPQDITIAIKHL